MGYIDMNKQLSLQLFFIDGKPDGMLTAEVFNWKLHILVVPRTRLSDALKRKESSYTGAYILLGEQDGSPCAYIGESEAISGRIKSHDSEKDWWTKAILITSVTNHLNKAHAQYLESKLVDMSQKANNIHLENNTQPKLPSLPEADIASMNEFIEQFMVILPAIQVDMFVSKIKTSDASLTMESPSDNPVFELTLKSEGVKATAVLVNGDFVVQKGSLARGEYIGKKRKHTSYLNLYQKLVEQGVLVDNGKNKVFDKSYAFSSTSAAGAICKGRATSGPINWKVQGTNQTYKEWESELLNQDPIN